MKSIDEKVVNLPMYRIVFDDLHEYVQFENLAGLLGMGRDWPIAMLRDYLHSYIECSTVFSSSAAGSGGVGASG